MKVTLGTSSQTGAAGRPARKTPKPPGSAAKPASAPPKRGRADSYEILARTDVLIIRTGWKDGYQGSQTLTAVGWETRRTRLYQTAYQAGQKRRRRCQREHGPGCELETCSHWLALWALLGGM